VLNPNDGMHTTVYNPSPNPNRRPRYSRAIPMCQTSHMLRVDRDHYRLGCNGTRTGAELISSQYLVTCDSRSNFGTVRIVLYVLYRRSNYDLHPVLLNERQAS
jgi:hypothetical protein